MREYVRWGDAFPTVTVLASASGSVAGQTWRCVVPLAGLTFDQRADQEALVGFVLGAAFGGTAGAPAHVSCRVLANAHLENWSGAFDPRQIALGSVAVEFAFGASFAGMTDIPLIFYCIGIATDHPDSTDDVTLPVVTTNTTGITFKDIDGGAHGTHATQL